MNDAPWYYEVSIPALLRHARRTYGRAMRKALEAAGYDDIPSNGLYIIGGLARGNVPLRDLVKQLGTSKQGAGQLVDALVTRGYLSRQPDKKDRRQVVIAVTDRGRAAADILDEVVRQIDSDVNDRLGAEDLLASRRVLGTLIEMQRVEAEAEA